MQKVSINAYEYNELNEIAKNKVKEYFNDFETFYQVEAEESLNKFCEIYNIKWQEWAIWGSYVNYEFLDTNLEDLSYIRLYKYIQNNIDEQLENVISNHNIISCKNPIFIIGCGHSGTTLFRKLL